MTWVAVAVGAGTLIYGVYQKESAKKDAKKIKNKPFEIPEAHKERMGRVKSRENMGMPGQEAMEQKIGASTASGITAFKEMGNQASFQNMIQQSIQQQNQQYADIGIKAAQFKLDRQLDVDKALGDTAAYQEKSQDIERKAKEAELARLRDRQAAGEQNIAQGAQMGVSGFASGAGGEKKKKGSKDGSNNIVDDYNQHESSHAYGN